MVVDIAAVAKPILTNHKQIPQRKKNKELPISTKTNVKIEKQKFPTKKTHYSEFLESFGVREMKNKYVKTRWKQVWFQL